MEALASLEVGRNHVPGNQGIKGNKAADQLARAAIKKDDSAVMTPLEDGTYRKDSIDEPKGTMETMISISPNCTSSKDSDSLDEEPDAPEAISDTQIKAEREGRKCTVRFKEVPEFMDSPILGQKPSRRSLFQTPTMPPIPFTGSTLTQLKTKQPVTLIGNEKKIRKRVFLPFSLNRIFPLSGHLLT